MAETGFRLRVVGTRGKGGRIAFPALDLLKRVEGDVHEEMTALRDALEDHTPVYEPRPAEKKGPYRYRHSELKAGWRLLPTRITSDTGLEIDIINPVRAKHWSGTPTLISLLTRTGVKKHLVEARNAPWLVFPLRSGGWTKRRIVEVGFARKRFLDPVFDDLDERGRLRMERRIQKGATQAVLSMLDEGLRGMRVTDSVYRGSE